MAPKKTAAKGKEVAQEQATEPRHALLKCSVVNEEGLAKVRKMAAAATNEWGATKLWPGSKSPVDLPATAYPVFTHAIIAGFVAPPSAFLLAILEHYQIHLLHLQPNSITILTVFAYLCEAFFGIKPSVELFRHFYSLRVTANDQISGCVSFRFEGKKELFIPMVVSKKVEDFRHHWVYMDLVSTSLLFEIPTEVAERNPNWSSKKIPAKKLEVLASRIAFFRNRGLTAQMVAKEYVYRRISPL